MQRQEDMRRSKGVWSLHRGGGGGGHCIWEGVVYSCGRGDVNRGHCIWEWCGYCCTVPMF